MPVPTRLVAGEGHDLQVLENARDDRDRVVMFEGSITMVFAYFAPEVALPVASAVAAALGFLMMVGRAPFRFAARAFRAATRGGEKTADRPDA
jgi:hypothetical protein